MSYTQQYEDIFVPTPLPHEPSDNLKEPVTYTPNYFSEVFKFFGTIKNWDDYARLFFVVWNSEPDIYNALREFYWESSIIQNAIENIILHGGYGYRCDIIGNYFINYNKSIESKDTELRNDVINEIINHLHVNHSFPSSNQSIISYMDPEQREQIMALEKKNEELANELEKLQDEIERSHQEVERLRDEAANHQVKLGNAMNFSWKDDDPNHPCQLMKEIEFLQRELSAFTNVKGSPKISQIKINIQAANELFKKYKCSITYDGPQMKSILGAVLQRHIFEFIYREISNYFDDQHGYSFCEITNLPNDLLEVGIIKKTKDLINLTNRFSKVNRGNDEYTNILPIKIRQQIYAALSNRGFANRDHPLIQKIVKDLLELMDKYRTIESNQKKTQLPSEAKDLVYRIMKLFHFRMYTQELPPKVLFYESGDIFDIEIMDEIISSLGDSEECDIEICAFPAT
ncbi:13541_t:CDS:2 [Gigaspora rosea]|nr:13541_t:CDS:2 [Gigaspora rosea]